MVLEKQEKQTRVEIIQELSDRTNLPKVVITQVFQECKNIMDGHLEEDGSGEIIVPFLGIKIRRVKKKASKERQILSPLTGKVENIAGKPERYALKVTAMKSLKDAVES